MATVTTAPFGSWPTPITSRLVVAAAVRLSEVRTDGESIVWSEERPAEGGRTQLVRRDPDGTTTDLLPAGMNARTAVHEYGGGAWWVSKDDGGTIWFTNWTDQRLYRLEPGGEPVPLTAEPQTPRGDRWADGELTPDGASIVCIREHHPAGGAGAVDVRNEIVRLAAAGPPSAVSSGSGPSEPEVLVSGPDFVVAPRVSPDGGALAWVQWDHPAMPWDATALMVRDLITGVQTHVAGGPEESVFQPCWQPDGSLWFLSDRTNWWNLYRWSPGGAVEPVVTIDADIGAPIWLLSPSRYVVLADGRVVFARWRDGYDGLAVCAANGAVTELDLPFSAISTVRATGPDAVVVVASTPTTEAGVHRIGLGTGTPVRTSIETLRPPRDLGLDPGCLSIPEAVSFPSVDKNNEPRTAHALFYPPASSDHCGPEGERPPLLVAVHGGPTGMAVPSLSMAVQYWTSRGFAVVDVNYGGSTGYGRDYRKQLQGAWGVVDVADCIAAARWLATQGRVDSERLCIRGGSAGGYTTLAALAREDTPFAAGADHFGVADLAALLGDTHKFESRYLDSLVGPYPRAREIYVERSPIHHIDRFTRPLIVLQGSEDAVVPPNQSEMIVDALRARGVPVAYLLFDGEQHGFRHAENIRRALDAELSFYAQVLGFALPLDEGIEPVPIENLRSTHQ